MDQVLLWTAAGIATVTFAIHTFAGGAAVARPLLADRSLPPASKWLNYYCWHITTVLIVFIAGALAIAAIDPVYRSLAVFCALLTGSLAILSGWVATKAQVSPFRFPSTSLFALISLTTSAALWGHYLWVDTAGRGL